MLFPYTTGLPKESCLQKLPLVTDFIKSEEERVKTTAGGMKRRLNKLE